jgi:hypothetical protein
MINGFIILISFGIVRMAFIGMYYYKLYYHWDDFVKSPAYIILSLGFLANAIHVLNIVWFYKILSGLITILKIRSKQSKKHYTTNTNPEKKPKGK